jgi:hypothetical protein
MFAHANSPKSSNVVDEGALKSVLAAGRNFPTTHTALLRAFFSDGPHLLQCWSDLD